MFYLCKTVVDSDFCMRVLCGPSGIYIVESAAISMYSMKEGGLRRVKTVRFFDVIRSVDVVESRIIVVFNGCLSVLDKDLNVEGGGSEGLQTVDRYRFGRSCTDYRNIGAYVAHTDQSICLVSFFGQMVLYTLDTRLVDPVEYSTNASVLDFKASREARFYLSLERSGEKTILNVYEHRPGIMVLVRGIETPGGYMIIQLEESLFAVVSSERMYLIREFERAEAYEITDMADREVDLTKMFTCYSWHRGPRCTLKLIVNEAGDLFRIESTGELKMRHVARVGPCIDMVIHPRGFLITLGHNSDNCVYHLKETEGEVGLDPTDSLSVLGPVRGSSLVHDKVHRIYISGAGLMREIVREEPLSFLSRTELSESREPGDVFGSGGRICAVYGRHLHNLSFDGNELAGRYECNLEEELVGYRRLKGLDFYLMNGLVSIVDAGKTVKEHRIQYDVFCSAETAVFLAHENNVFRVSSTAIETIELEFVAKGIASNDAYLFILTGKRVIRTYDLAKRKYVFIQSLRSDVAFVLNVEGCLYAAGEKVHRFKICDDGSLSLLRVLRSTGMPIGIKENLILFREAVIDVRSGEMMRMDGDRSIVFGERVVIAEGAALSVYRYECSPRLVTRPFCERECRIICKEAMYIDNSDSGFSIRGFDGVAAFEGSGHALSFCSSEHRVILVSRSLDGEETHFLQVHGESLMYEFRTELKVQTLATSGKMVYCGSENLLYCYEVGKKTLLKKFRMAVPSRITTICPGEEMVFVGTAKSSVCGVLRDRMFNEQLPRHITALGIVGTNRLIVGDKTGSVLIMEIMENSLATRAQLFVNDMPIEFVCGDRVFAVCLSGKVCEVVEIDESLFEFLEKTEGEVSECLGRPFFEMFRRNAFVDAEYLKMLYKLDEKQILRVSEKAGADAEKMFDVINLL